MTSATVASILPTGIYDDASLQSVLGVSAQSLAKARRCGELRHRRVGQRVLYLGEWVLTWLAGVGGEHV
jgi:hypothetical protein